MVSYACMCDIHLCTVILSAFKEPEIPFLVVV